MKRRILLTVIVLLGIFATWNIIWLIYVNVKFEKYMEAVPKNDLGAHILEKDGYVFNVKKPEYLSFTGNLGVSKLNSLDGLIIWPLLFGGYEYGLRLQTEEGVLEITVDDNKELLQSKMNKTTYDKYKEDIEKLFAIAEEVWDLP
ncbi:hypothetical protein [Bacillus kwashiorkori]|uniref:hypothetical protein n=1 Tax=Bacillus kwashiorkori TaxID=1522318 RepID=UPI0007818DB0|nr:hypothetical protein [Bacillus kwashiorkori]